MPRHKPSSREGLQRDLHMYNVRLQLQRRTASASAFPAALDMPRRFSTPAAVRFSSHVFAVRRRHLGRRRRNSCGSNIADHTHATIPCLLQMHLAFTRQTTLACLAFSLAHTRRVPFPSPLTTIVSRRLPSCNTARARPAQHNPQNLRGCCVQPWRNGAKSFKFPCGHRTRQSTLQSTPEFSHESVCAPVMTSDGSGWPQGSSCSSGGHAGSSCLRSSICTHRTGTSAHCSRLRTVRRIPNLAHMQLRVGQGACFQAA